MRTAFGLAAILVAIGSLQIQRNLWASPTEDQAILDKKLDEFEFWGDPRYAWPSEFQSLCYHADLVCGTEILPSFTDELWTRQEERVLRNTTVRTVLNEILAEAPGYHWVIDRGVILIIPRETFGNKIRRFWHGRGLDRKIKTLDLVNTPLDVAAYKACRAAGFECRPGKGATVSCYRDLCGMGLDRPYRKITLRLSDVTLKEALNAMVRQDGHSRWSFQPPESAFADVRAAILGVRESRASCTVDQWGLPELQVSR